MNKKFMLHMIKAKKMECEAFRELLPKNINEKIEAIEKRTRTLIKQWVMEVYQFEMAASEQKISEINKKIEIK